MILPILKKVQALVERVSRRDSVSFVKVAPAFNRLWNTLEKYVSNVSIDKFQGVLVDCGKLGNARRNWYKEHEYWNEYESHLDQPASTGDRDSIGEQVWGDEDEDLDCTAEEDEELAIIQRTSVTEFDHEDVETFSVPDGVIRVPMRALTNNERIGVMARLGLLLLRKHYNRSSDASVIALALDPRYGFEYLERSSWSDSVTSYVEPAIKDVIRIYNMITPNETEASVPSTASNKIQKTSESVATSTSNSKLSSCKQKNNYDNYISSDSDSDDDRSHSETLPVLSELDRYKKIESLPRETDPLMWWFERRSLYPLLSNVFLDHATIPATSISPEQLFSSMGLLCTSSRNRMKHSTITKLTCLKNWFSAVPSNPHH